jgi:hypothetical protein
VLLTGVGNPNNVRFAPRGSIYFRHDLPEVWQNIDGARSWQLCCPVTGSQVFTGQYTGNGSNLTQGIPIPGAAVRAVQIVGPNTTNGGVDPTLFWKTEQMVALGNFQTWIVQDGGDVGYSATQDVAINPGGLSVSNKANELHGLYRWVAWR